MCNWKVRNVGDWGGFISPRILTCVNQSWWLRDKDAFSGPDPLVSLAVGEMRLPTDSLSGRGGRERHCSLLGTCHRLGGPPWSLGTGLQGQLCRVAACAQGHAMHGWAAGCVCTLGSWPEWGVYRVFTGREHVLTPAEGVLCKHTCCSRRVTGGQAHEPQGTARGPPFPWPVC